MDHRECIERLPWYLAGSLEAAEKDAMAAHLEGCSECRDELEATRAGARLFAEEHPSSEALAAFAWSDLPPTEARLVERHVASCAECREELALARASRGLEGGAVDPRVVPLPVRRDAGLSWRRAALWAAALVAVVGLGFGIAGTRRASRLDAERARLTASLSELQGAATAERAAAARAELAERRAADLQSRLSSLLAPQAGLAVVELLPLAATRGAEEPALTSVERGHAGYVTLLLALERPAAFRSYSVRLRGPDGGELWSTGGVRPDESGALTLLVPTTLLPGGLVGVEVEGEAAGGTRPAATYRLFVRVPAPAAAAR